MARKILEHFSVVDGTTGDRLPFEVFISRKFVDDLAATLNATFNESNRFFVVIGDRMPNGNWNCLETRPVVKLARDVSREREG